MDGEIVCAYLAHSRSILFEIKKSYLVLKYEAFLFMSFSSIMIHKTFLNFCADPE